MTTPPDLSRFLDTGNQLLAQAPVRLELGMLSGPQGRIGVLTLRSATTTMTVLATGEDLLGWAKMITEFAGQLGAGAGLAPASPADVMNLRRQLDGHGHP